LAHLDSTSFHVDGRYNSDAEPDEQVIHITRGYSRDHRPDLNQVMLELIVEHQAGIPVLMQPLSGNSSDAHEFGQVIQEHSAPLQTTYGLTYLVADSALYSEGNLQKFAATRLKWITRVPATLHEAQQALAQANPQSMAPLTEGYRYHVLPSSYGGVAQHWVLIYSEPRQPQVQHTVDKQLLKQSAQEVQALKKLFALPLPVKPMQDRRWRPLHRVCRPPTSTRAPSAPRHAIASGGARAQALNPTTWSTISQGLSPLA
jgi:transposase